MTKKIAKALMHRRRNEVARLRERGFSLGAIHELIKNNPDIRNTNGDAWSYATIANDLTYFDELWQAETSRTVHQLKSEQLNKIRLVQQQASQEGNWNLFLKAIEQEIKLTGTSAPLQININIVSRLITAIERTGQDANPVLEAMINHLESQIDE